MSLRPSRTLLAALLAIACSGGGGTKDGAPGPGPSARTYGVATTWLWFGDLAPTAGGGFVAVGNDGADAFAFEVVDTLAPADTPGYDPTEDLESLLALWMDKLRPFEPAGYHQPRRPHDAAGRAVG